MTETVLSIKGLRKQMGGKPIIKDISFDVYAGEVFGFLGPNGVSKTTTIRMLVGLASADAGEIHIGGISLHKHFPQAIAQVGCIVENPELYKFMTGRENLEHFARMSGGISRERIEEIVRFVDLQRAIDDKVKTYSLGMRQRLGIAQALLHNPKLLILDEPTNGLDPAGIRELRQFIRRLAEEEGLAVFISSHLLSEIEMMCDRVAIIGKGKVISVGLVKDLMEQFGDQVEWSVSPETTEAASRILRALPFVEEAVASKEGRIMCKMDTERIAEANRTLVLQGIAVLGIAAKTVTLEDLFLALTTEEGEQNMGMLDLVQNETIKILRRRRFLVILLILAILIPIFTYAQYRSVLTAQEQMGTSDWRALLQQKIVDTQSRLASSRLPEEWREFLKITVQQQQYYLDHDINPMAPGAPTFARGFMDQAISLFLPMIIVVLAVDLVSAEFSEGTIKLLLTRPVRRWKVLTSKYVTLLLFTSLTVLMTLILAALISGVVFGYAGWDILGC